jgi:hypothetical protein
MLDLSPECAHQSGPPSTVLILWFHVLNSATAHSCKRDAHARDLRERFQRDLAGPVLSQEINPFRRRANHPYKLARLTRQEGRVAIVTNARWDAVDAAVSSAQLESQGGPSRGS